MRIGLNGYKPEIYFAQYSTGKRICNDFEIYATTFQSLKYKILKEAEECRNSHRDMLHKGLDLEFTDSHILTQIIGKSLKEKIKYSTYKSLSEADKQKFARIFSEIILNSEANNLYVSSCPFDVSADRNAYIPLIRIHLGSSMTKEKLNGLIDKELQQKNSKLHKLGIQPK